MKTKGRRKSSNIEDIRDPAEKKKHEAKLELQRLGTERMGGSLKYTDYDRMADIINNDPDTRKSIGRNIAFRKPYRDPPPQKLDRSSKPNGIANIQVTPGEWETKSSKPSYEKLKGVKVPSFRPKGKGKAGA